MKCNNAHSSERFLVQNINMRIRNTLHGVLDWCSREEETVSAMKTKESLPPNTGRVFYVLGFIENHILPFNTLEVLLILNSLPSPMSCAQPQDS